MRIVHRNPALKYPRAVYREKQQLVLDWLLEFRFFLFCPPGSTPRPDVPDVPTNSFARFATPGSCNGLPMTITSASSITCSRARAPPFCTKPGAILRTPAPPPPA